MYSSTMDEKMHSERMDEWEAKRQGQRVPTQAKRTHTQKKQLKIAEEEGYESDRK